jgi:hypothetical protein
MVKLSELRSEKSRLENERLQFQREAERTTQRYLDENSQVEQECKQLQAELQSLEVHFTSKERFYRDQLLTKKSELQSFRQAIEVARTTQETLSQEVADLRRAAVRMQRNQARLIHRARDLCTQEVAAVVSERVSRRTRDDSERLARLQADLDAERAEYDRNEELCRRFLEAIWAMREGAPHPDVTPADFVDRLPELKAFVDDSLEYYAQRAVDELKYEVQKRLPDIEFGEDSVVVAVQKYTARKVQDKEREYQRAMRREEDRERRLKRKLRESLAKIQQMDDPSSESEDGLLVELDEMKKEWDLRRRQLDDKMRELKNDRGTPVT